MREQRGTSSLSRWLVNRHFRGCGTVLRMDEDRLPRHVFYCLSARSVAEDCRVGQLKLRQGHRNKNKFWDIQPCNPGRHEEGFSGGTTFRDILKCLATLN
eukprot:109419-Chlamydomonas_euryale.AAC.1